MNFLPQPRFLTDTSPVPEKKPSPSQDQNKPVGEVALKGKPQKTALQKVGKGAKVTGEVAAAVVATSTCVALFFFCLPIIFG